MRNLIALPGWVINPSHVYYTNFCYELSLSIVNIIIANYNIIVEFKYMCKQTKREITIHCNYACLQCHVSVGGSQAY